MFDIFWNTPKVFFHIIQSYQKTEKMKALKMARAEKENFTAEIILNKALL